MRSRTDELDCRHEQRLRLSELIADSTHMRHQPQWDECPDLQCPASGTAHAHIDRNGFSAIARVQLGVQHGQLISDRLFAAMALQADLDVGAPRGDMAEQCDVVGAQALDGAQPVPAYVAPNGGGCDGDLRHGCGKAVHHCSPEPPAAEVAAGLSHS